MVLALTAHAAKIIVKTVGLKKILATSAIYMAVKEVLGDETASKMLNYLVKPTPKPVRRVVAKFLDAIIPMPVKLAKVDAAWNVIEHAASGRKPRKGEVEVDLKELFS